MSTLWDERLLAMYKAKQDLAAEDYQNLLPHYLPALAASAMDLQNAEELLGFGLDSEYRAFLAHADGWRGIMLHVDLFGTKQLAGSPEMDHALALLDAIEDARWQPVGLEKYDVYPIAAAPNDKDLFVIAKQDSPRPGAVVWLAGEEVARYTDFAAYFEAMIEFNRKLLEEL